MIQMTAYKKHISVHWLNSAIILILIMTFFAIRSPADAAAANKQKSFSSPEGAVKAMVSVFKSNDQKMLTAIFGDESKELFSSGDEVADRKYREHFLKFYEKKISWRRWETKKQYSMSETRTGLIPFLL
jgi:hypothetical protein